MRSLIVLILMCIALPYAFSISVNLDAIIKNKQVSSKWSTTDTQALGKRSIFVPYKWMPANGHQNKSSATIVIPYCWLVDGYEPQKRWIQAGLDEGWNSLGVLQYADVGLCNTVEENYAEELGMLAITGTHCNQNRLRVVENTIYLYLGNESYPRGCLGSRNGCGDSPEAHEQCLKKVAMHEFGHALGLKHEQVRFDIPDAFQRECHPKPSEVTYVHNQTFRYLGGWDEVSIMNYCARGYFNLSQAMPLSKEDRAAVLSTYGSAAYFNAECTSQTDPASPACASAIHRFCRAAIGSPHATGLLRNQTTFGLNVTCFEADFNIATTAAWLAKVAATSAGSESIAAGNICQRWANERGQYVSESLFGVVANLESSGKATLACTVASWEGSLDRGSIVKLAGMTGDRSCYRDLQKPSATSKPPASCLAAAESYCRIHHNSSGATVLARSTAARAIEIKLACFQSELKFELMTKLVAFEGF